MKKKIDFDTVRKLGLTLAGVEESTTHGSPALKVRGKLMAWIPVHRGMEPDVLAVRIDLDRRAELMAEAPEIYFVTDHYADYPAVLIRLTRVSSDALRDLLTGAWRYVTSKK